MNSAQLRPRGTARLIGSFSLVLGTVLLAGPAAMAGTITFNDLGSLSFTDSTGGRATGSCTHGAGVNGPGSDAVCVVTLQPVNGSASWSSTNILETLSNNISDTLLVNPMLDPNTFAIQFFTITFTSGGNLTPLSGANSMRENGSLQTGAVITWSGGATDVIQFQSSDAATPEPGSWMLGGTGLALLFVTRLRRKR